MVESREERGAETTKAKVGHQLAMSRPANGAEQRERANTNGDNNREILAEYIPDRRIDMWIGV